MHPKPQREESVGFFVDTAQPANDSHRSSEDEESSEGEDWEDGMTLVNKFMDVDPE